MCQEEEACKGMLLKRFGMRGAPSMLEKREMVSTRKKNRNTTFLNEHLCTGHICPSKFPMASPFFFVKKKDGSLHPVQDY